MTTPGHEPGPLALLTRGLVAAMKRRYGKGPVSARAHLIERDVLVVVMRGAATSAERSMAAAGRESEARAFRLAFQDAYESEIRSLVEEHLARRVATYHSQIVFDPDLLFEIFVLDRRDADGKTPMRSGLSPQSLASWREPEDLALEVRVELGDARERGHLPSDDALD